MISIIIPVLNEARVIGPALEALLRQPGDYEIIVVDGGSDDGTREIVQAFPVKLVTKPPDLPAGLGVQNNLGAELARGEVLLFLHIDVRLPDKAIARVKAALANAEIVGGGFVPTFGNDFPAPAQLALGVVERAWRARTRAFRWFAGDQAPFIQREAFRACGGYPTIALAADWAFASRLRALGQLAVIEQPVLVSARRHLANGVVKTLLVTGSVEVMYRAGVDAAFLARWYRRWLPREREEHAIGGG
jgi:rSAM/selenodomain-associated transferase 2